MARGITPMTMVRKNLATNLRDILEKASMRAKLWGLLFQLNPRITPKPAMISPQSSRHRYWKLLYNLLFPQPLAAYITFQYDASIE